MFIVESYAVSELIALWTIRSKLTYANLGYNIIINKVRPIDLKLQQHFIERYFEFETDLSELRTLRRVIIQNRHGFLDMNLNPTWITITATLST